MKPLVLVALGILMLIAHDIIELYIRNHQPFTRNATNTGVSDGVFNYIFDNQFHSVCYIYKLDRTKQAMMSCVKVADSVTYTQKGPKT